MKKKLVAGMILLGTVVSFATPLTGSAEEVLDVQRELQYIGHAQAQVDLYSCWKECRGFYEIADWKDNYNAQGTERLGSLLSRLQRDYPGIHPQLVPEDSTTIVAKGAGVINYDYGTNFIVRIYEREEVKGRSARSL